MGAACGQKLALGWEMAGILGALQEFGLKCYSPASGASGISGDEDDLPSPKLDYRPFEVPKPKQLQIEVESALPTDPSLFKYFMDGSMRTTSAGFVRDPMERFLPIFIAQVGVAATTLNGLKIAVEDFKSKNILFLPDSFRDQDLVQMRALIQNAAHASPQRVDLELECYRVEDNEEPIDGARKKVLSAMHTLETDLIRDYAQERKVRRDRLLIIDGSLQFYENLERNKESFRNVVGVSKSFKLNRRIGSAPRASSVGTQVAHLKPRYRTPAHRVHIERQNLTVGAWYLRLRSPTYNASALSTSGSTDGVVKLEIFPDDDVGAMPALDTDRCNRISKHILALRHPATPTTDSRWASHLYPVYLTERYIKSRFRSEMTMRALL